MTELKNCPFCGDEATITKYPASKGIGGHNAGYSIRCSNGYCRIAQTACDTIEKDKMIKQWNARAPTEREKRLEEALRAVANCDSLIIPPEIGKIIEKALEEQQP